LKPNQSKKTSVTDTSGILLGDKVYWNPAKLRNGHAAILGTSGSGKTQTLKAIAHELPLLFPDIKIVVADFHGDLELPNEVCYALDAESPYGLNPLVIDLDPKGGGPDLQAIA
ncbi:MAG: helicase HerA domain-containing protein, partial [Nostoc sp.]